MQERATPEDYGATSDKRAIEAAVPAWITPDLIAQTIRVWQPYYKTRLTREDAVTMIISVAQLFDAL